VTKLKIPSKLPPNYTLLVNSFLPQLYVSWEAGSYLKQDCILQSLMRETDSHTLTCESRQFKQWHLNTGTGLRRVFPFCSSCTVSAVTCVYCSALQYSLCHRYAQH